MINTTVTDISSHIVSKLSQIIVQFFDEKLSLCVFEPSFATYIVYLRFIGNLVVDFLFLLVELFFTLYYG